MKCPARKKLNQQVLLPSLPRHRDRRSFFGEMKGGLIQVLPNPGSHSDSSDTASTIKRWNSRWTPSEGYDSSDTSSVSEEGGECIDNYPQNVGLSEPTITCQTAYRMPQECQVIF